MMDPRTQKITYVSPAFEQIWELPREANTEPAASTPPWHESLRHLLETHFACLESGSWKHSVTLESLSGRQREGASVVV